MTPKEFETLLNSFKAFRKDLVEASRDLICESTPDLAVKLDAILHSKPIENPTNVNDVIYIITLTPAEAAKIGYCLKDKLLSSKGPESHALLIESWFIYSFNLLYPEKAFTKI